MIYLKEKRWQETTRLLIYGVAFFFGPFLIYGGMGGLKNFIGLLVAREQELPTIWGTVRGAANNILMGVLGLEAESSVPIAVAVETLFLIVCLFLFFRTKQNWKMLFYLSMILIAYIPTNLMYTSVYLLPPFLCFLKEKKEVGGESKIYGFYLILFSLIFSLPALFVMVGMSSYMTFVLIMYCMFGCCVIESVWDMISALKLKRRDGMELKKQDV